MTGVWQFGSPVSGIESASDGLTFCFRNGQIQRTLEKWRSKGPHVLNQAMGAGRSTSIRKEHGERTTNAAESSQADPDAADHRLIDHGRSDGLGVLCRPEPDRGR